MTLTPAQKTDLVLIRRHGAHMVHNSHRMGDYTWWSGEKAVGATLYKLAQKGAVVISGDRATITPLGDMLALEGSQPRKVAPSQRHPVIRAERVAARRA